MNTKLVVVLGGFGVFGARIVRSLARHAETDVVIAGRTAATTRLPDDLDPSRVRSVALDIANAAHVDNVLSMQPNLVIDAAGPFQQRDYSLARRCAARA